MTNHEPLRGEVVDVIPPHAAGSQGAPGPLRPEVVGERNDGPVITDPGALAAALCAVFLPFIGAFIAWPLAAGAKRRIHNSQGLLGGHKLALFAQIWALVNVAVCAFVVYLVIFVLHWAFTGIF